MYVIAVNKSQEFLLNVHRLFKYFFRRRRRRLHVDASYFLRWRKGFDFDDESMFFDDVVHYSLVIGHKTAISTISTSIVHSKLDYCNSLYYNLPNTQLNRLQHIENSLARAVIRAPKSSHINPALKSLHWLKIKQRIDYKILSLTYKVLTTSQPSYLYNLISVQPHRSTRSSDIINLSRPPSSSSLKVNHRSFRHASPYLWNQLPRIFSCLQITKTYHSHLLSHMSVRLFLHHHYYHPLLLLTSTSDSKLIFSTNLFLHSSSTFPPTGLTPRTPGVFRFTRVCRF